MLVYTMGRNQRAAIGGAHRKLRIEVGSRARKRSCVKLDGVYSKVPPRGVDEWSTRDIPESDLSQGKMPHNPIAVRYSQCIGPPRAVLLGCG